MRTGISFTVSSHDRQRLQAIVAARHDPAAQQAIDLARDTFRFGDDAHRVSLYSAAAL